MISYSIRWIFLFLILIGCTETKEDIEPAAIQEERPNQEGWNSKVIFSTKGIVDAELFYTHMMRWDSRQMTTFNENIRIDFYEKGTHNGTLTADSGQIVNNSNSFMAIGNVVVVSDSGVSMRAPKMFWDDKKQQIFAEGFVTMTTEEDTLHGYDFESDRNLTNWKMRNAFGQSARDVDLKTGSIRSKKESNKDMDKEIDAIIKQNKN